MAWFKRTIKGIRTNTKDKKDTPEGLWHKTPTGKIIDTEELEKNFYVSPEDDFHLRIGSEEYFKIIFEIFVKAIILIVNQFYLTVLIQKLDPMTLKT